MVPFIEISFKSYEYQYIQNSFQQIQEYIPQFWQYKSFFLPNKIKKFIILRSPHIDKKSREQFQFKSYKNTIIIVPTLNKPELTYNEVYLFLDNIKQCSFLGVQIQIQVVYRSYLTE